MALTVYSPLKGEVVIAGNPNTATVNPGVGNDVSQGYIVGSLWLNTSSSAVFLCASNALGAAVWVSAGVAASPTFVNLTLTGLLYESSQSGIVAGTTRTQAGATVLTKEVSRIDTATAPAAGSTLGDGALMIPSASGLDATVINNTAFPVQLYGAGTDTINGVAATVGVALPPGDVANLECAATGAWHFEPGVGAFGSLPIFLSAENITAVNPVAQATAVPFTAVINHVTTVNAAGAAGALPAAKYGLEQAVENATANPLTVYPVNGGSDVINGQAANAPIIIPGFTTVLFRAASGGVWQSDPFFNAAGAAPSTGGVALGSAVTGLARSGGTVSVQTNTSNSALAATPTVLYTFALPANAFDVANRQVNLAAAGTFAANANAKTIQIYVGPDVQTPGSAVVTTSTTSIATSGVVNTNGGGWTAQASVVKLGANGANTQRGVNQGVVAGSVHTGTQAPVALTIPENAPIYITVTATTPTAAADAVGQFFDLAFGN
jgi:hypothetical protein